MLDRAASLDKDDAFGPVLSTLEDHLRLSVEQSLQAERAVKALVKVGRNYGGAFAQAFKGVKKKEVDISRLELAIDQVQEYIRQLRDECTRIQFDMSRIKSISHDLDLKAKLRSGRREMVRQVRKPIT